ncbi:hypothetical protein BDB00DRAFT_256144 [Zychaea mexicana]|uniref:uncharacterized protein n=1 Tax=Zychaea mexicana TaxID=64656 RepID=UPI0022FE2ACB|nr:uncharacterized protein BDB00DRAFT_256144 [Zychaea mexicana]KAI9495191.1 hypothetical protein BDB00DRAFT_256144 [Zychaea mexicana]
MPNGRADATCRNCPNHLHLSRMHVILCPQAYTRPNVSYVVLVPISFPLNSFPKARPTNTSKKQFWKNMWQRLTTLLADIDVLCHDNGTSSPGPTVPPTISNDFITWLETTQEMQINHKPPLSTSSSSNSSSPQASFLPFLPSLCFL